MLGLRVVLAKLPLRRRVERGSGEQDLHRQRCCIVEGVLAPHALSATRQSLIAILETTPTGRNDFEGVKTQRIYGLFAKTAGSTTSRCTA